VLTKAGLVTILTSAVVLGLGRIFGLPELFVLGAAGLTTVALSIAYVSVRRLKVEVDRQLTPPRVHAGNPCRVDLHLVNRSLLPTPVMRLRDEVSGTNGVELLVAPMRRAAAKRATYRLPTERRGLLRVGPLKLTVTDPFGLASLTTSEDRDVSLVVYPRIEELGSVRRSSGSDLERHQLLQHQVAPLGDEFYALREYVVGDDLRRVHWPSSARNDDLMVRQDEIPWHGHLTVLLDTRELSPPETFERMVSAAASLATAAVRRGDQVRVVTTGGQETSFSTGPYHLGRILELLALVEQGAQLSKEALERLTSMDAGGAVAAVTAGASELEGGLVNAAIASYRARFLVLFPSGRATPTVPGGPIRSTRVIMVDPDESFARAWLRSVGHSPRVGR
jgi:uncharacterized protein (DUF58 family)